MERLLIVKLSSLGDIMHALPAVDAIKRGTGAAIDWVTQREYVELVSCCPHVDDVISFDRRHPVRSLPRVRRALRARRYDAVIDLHGLLKSGIITWLSGCPRRIGPSFHREGSGLFYTEAAGAPDLDRHRVDQKRDIVSCLGLPTVPPRFPLNIEPASCKLPRPQVGILPCSRHAAKNWPAEHYTELCTRLIIDCGASVLLLGGSADHAVAASIAAHLPVGHCADMTGRTSIVELGGLVAGLDLVIGNDSGPLHLAAAMGTPVIGLYLDTDPLVFGPYGDQHRVLHAGPKGPPTIDDVYRAAAGRLLTRGT